MTKGPTPTSEPRTPIPVAVTVAGGEEEFGDGGRRRRPERAGGGGRRRGVSGILLRRSQLRDDDLHLRIPSAAPPLPPRRFHERIWMVLFKPPISTLACLDGAYLADYDLTGQLVWPGAVLMNTYLSENPETVKGRSIIELGSGIGITGILCSRFCKEVVLTDHNDEVLEIIKKNIEMQSCSGNADAVLTAEKLEWGNYDHISNIIEKHPVGFDLILGADICFQQSSIPCLFDTVEKLLRMQAGKCRFILAYVSRAKDMDALLPKEAEKRGMLVEEVDGTRTTISNLEGVIFDITLK